ncbi:MAG: molybdopterin synthase [Halobacteriales archaeon]|nr:molybdopterin synthase [Halobacteriales archaeon]
MHAIALSAPDVGALRDRLLAGLDGRGPVAVVERAEAAEAPVQGADSTYRVDETGRYEARAGAADLDALLDELAAGHELALLVGFEELALPRVTVGDDPDALVSAPTLEALDPAEVDEALESLEPIETLESLVARVKSAPDADRAGAIATFTGRVRARDAPDDVPTTELEFEKYEGVADERLAALEAELSARDGVQEVVLHHKTGVVEAGEDIVFVVVLAGHRGEAFETVEDGINRLKAEVPLFKKEVTVEDAFWVHERP